MEWATAAKIAYTAGKIAYVHRELLQRTYKLAQAKFDLGATEVVVMGHAGVGKSQLVNHFNGNARELRYSLPSESMRVEVDALKFGAKSKLVRTLPGQVARRTQEEIKIFEDDPELDGVVFLVDYGYVAPRGDAISAAMLRRDGLDTVEKLRDHNLKAELSDFDVLKSLIIKKREKHGFPSWLVIAVNKVDLYQHRLLDALDYYHPSGGGAFGKKVNDLVAHVGSSNLEVVVVQSCGHIQDFSWNDEIVKSTLTHVERDSILVNFQDVITSLIKVKS